MRYLASRTRWGAALAVWLAGALFLLAASSSPTQQARQPAANPAITKKLLEAKFAQHAGQLDAAERALKEVLESEPGNTEASKQLEAVWTAQKENRDRAQKLEVARQLREAGLLEDAKTKVTEILKTDPGDFSAQVELREVLDELNRLARRREQMQLDVAEGKLKAGERAEAITLSQKVLDATRDPGVTERAHQIQQRARSTKGWQFREALLPNWWLTVLGGILLVLLVSGALLLARSFYTAWMNRTPPPAPAPAQVGDAPRTWRFGHITDSTNQDTETLVLSALGKLRSAPLAPPVSAGLLSLGALPPRQVASLWLPELPLQLPAAPPTMDLLGAVEKLQLKVAGIEISALARFLAELKKWFNAKRPGISGVAYASASGGVTVRLTCYDGKGNIAVVSAASVAGDGTEAARDAAEKVAYKMYYLLATPDATEKEAEAAATMSEGLKLLNRYLTGDKDSLQRALEQFTAFRNARPDLLEAFLYEGIALDLLERHEEALARFTYVSENPEANDALREKARYNSAVAHMRKYRPADLQQAAAVFAQVATPNPDILGQPIKAMAKAGEANAVAHYPIFWQRLLFERSAQDDAERTEWKRQECRRANGSRVEAWVQQVEAIAKELRNFLPQIAPGENSPWHPAAKRQLEWAIDNAVGNVCLNVATGFLQPPWPADCADPRPRRNELLEKAHAEFQRCELLLPPGVETLTNNATALLFLEKYADARDYAFRAIELNPNYEYAYFRLAHSWDRENRPDQAKKVLEDYGRADGKRTVRIPEFKELFLKYNIPVPG